MAYLPVFLDLAGRTCLVVGGGRVACQKIRQLLDAGAEVKVVSPEVVPEIDAWARSDAGGTGRRLLLERRPYRAGDLAGVMLAFAATNDPAVQEAVVAEAHDRGVWLNCVDEPERCGFVMPAISRQGAVTLAVSTGGASPLLAGRIRDRLAAHLGEELDRAAEVLAALRRELPAGPARAGAFARLLDDGLVDALRDGRSERVEELVERARHESRPGVR